MLLFCINGPVATVCGAVVPRFDSPEASAYTNRTALCQTGPDARATRGLRTTQFLRARDWTRRNVTLASLHASVL